MSTSVIVVSWLVVETTFVSGLNFTLSKPRVVLKTPGKLLMMCHLTETDVSIVYQMQIRRETISGWKTLAIIESVGYGFSALHKDIINDQGFVVNGTLDDESPLNTYLTLEMDIEKMTYDDAREYRCELTYKSNMNDAITVKTNVMLLIDDANNTTDKKAEAGNKIDGRAEADNKTDGHAEANNKTDGRAGICVTSASCGAVSVTIAVSSVIVVICVFVVIVVLIKLRRNNQEAHKTRGEYVPEKNHYITPIYISEKINYITPISDFAVDWAYTTEHDNDTDGSKGGYENQNAQRNVNESLHKRSDEDHGSGYCDINM